MKSQSMRQLIDLVENREKVKQLYQKAHELSQKHQGRKIRIKYGLNQGIEGEIKYFLVDDKNGEYEILVVYKVVGGKPSSRGVIADIGFEKWAYPDQIEFLK